MNISKRGMLKVCMLFGSLGVALLAFQNCGQPMQAVGVQASIQAVPVTLAPTTPVNVTATATSATEITLTWGDPSPADAAASSYMIQRAVVASGTVGTYTTLATLNGGVLSYNDTSVMAATEYAYTITSSNSIGTAAVTAAAMATTPVNTGVSFATTVLPIMKQYCTSCHEAGAANFALSLSMDLSSYANIMAANKIAPNTVVAGSASTSLLYTQCASNLMPLPANYPASVTVTPIPSTALTAIQNWINQGALNN